MVNPISPEQLAEMLNSGEFFTLIDTRPEDSYGEWQIHRARNLPIEPEAELMEKKG